MHSVTTHSSKWHKNLQKHNKKKKKQKRRQKNKKGNSKNLFHKGNIVSSRLQSDTTYVCGI